MGNRTHLFFFDRGQIDANNCLPVTWLSLFDKNEYVIERSIIGVEKGNIFKRISNIFLNILGKNSGQQLDTPRETVAAGYRTSRDKAIQRVDSFISRIKGHSPAWSFLRPLEVLRNELSACPEGSIIVLDLTEFWAKDEDYGERAKVAAFEFSKMVDGFNGQTDHDLSLLDNLIKNYLLGNITSIRDLSPDDRMFVFIGTYTGDEERENHYSHKFFDENYWDEK
jgi:hypothetical protein